MTKPKVVNPHTESIETDPQRMVSDWVDAINDFNQWNGKLINVIDAHCLTKEDVINPLGKIGNQRAMTNLMQLRLSLVNILEKLLRDVNIMDEEHDTLLKIENLHKQTQTIHQWNEKIRQALEINSCGTA